MGIVRDWVAQRGHALDGFAGLGLKAYLIPERGVQGSPVNAYALFYIWADTRGMSRFLFGGAGFGGVVASFGRSVVRQWSALAFSAGSVRRDLAAFGFQAGRVPSDRRRPAGSGRARPGGAGRVRPRPGLHSAVACIDPMRWEVLLFSLWEAHAPEEPGSVRYHVPPFAAGNQCA